jgi:predicted NUDIX family NTP pyrophosphohydrolase
MAAKTSAGLLMFRQTASDIEVLLAHPGGPFFARKDDGVWTIPKGVMEPGEEDPLQRARIEFEEELGIAPPAHTETLSLGSVRQKGGKIVHAWAVKGDLPAEFVCKSNPFDLEWPPRSGKIQSFPEIDRACFFSLKEAARKINPAQKEFLTRLEDLLQKGAG